METQSGKSRAIVAFFCCILPFSLAYASTFFLSGPLGHLPGPLLTELLSPLLTAFPSLTYLIRPLGAVIFLFLYALVYTFNMGFFVKSCLREEAMQNARRRVKDTTIIHWMIAVLSLALVIVVFGVGLSGAGPGASGGQLGASPGGLVKLIANLLALVLVVAVVALVVEYFSSAWSLLRSGGDNPGVPLVAYLAITYGVAIPVFPLFLSEPFSFVFSFISPGFSSVANLWALAAVASTFNLSVAWAVVRCSRSHHGIAEEQGAREA